MKKTGEVLRKAREEKGLSLHEVGIFLKINTRILQAIENGDLSKLPAKTFLRGFVQSYAKYLKLNSDEVLELFQSELKPPVEESIIENSTQVSSSEPLDSDGTTSASNSDVVDTEHATPNRSTTNQSVLMGPGLTTDALKLKTIVISALALVLVFVVYFGNNLIRRYQKEAEIPEEVSLISNSNESPTKESTPSVLTAENITPVATTTAPLSLSVVETKTPTSSTKTIVTPPSAEPPTTSQQKTASETTSLPTTPQSQTPNSDIKSAEGKSVEVIVEAKDNVEIEYASAKSAPQKLLLKSDQIHTFKSRSGVRLKISNGGAVNVIVNGQDLGAPGALGQSIQLTYE